MRRSAKLGIATGALVAGAGMAAAVAIPHFSAGSDGVTASAAGAKAPVKTAATWRGYGTPDAFKNLGANGSYLKLPRRVIVRGNLRDWKRDTWTACVRFRLTENGADTITKRFMIVDEKNRAFDQKAVVSFKFQSWNNGHLYVQECRRNKKTGKFVYASRWRTLF